MGPSDVPGSRGERGHGHRRVAKWAGLRRCAAISDSTSRRNAWSAPQASSQESVAALGIARQRGMEDLGDLPPALRRHRHRGTG